MGRDGEENIPHRGKDEGSQRKLERGENLRRVVWLGWASARRGMKAGGRVAASPGARRLGVT